MYSVQVSETFPYSLVSTLISFNKSISWHIYRVSGFGNWDYDPFHRIDKMEMFSFSENAGAFSVWIFLTSIEISLFKIEILNKFDNKSIDKYVDISAWRLTFCSKIYSDHLSTRLIPLSSVDIMPDGNNSCQNKSPQLPGMAIRLPSEITPQFRMSTLYWITLWHASSQ